MSDIREDLLTDFLDSPVTEASLNKLHSHVSTHQLIAALDSSNIAASTYRLIIEVLGKVVRLKEERLAILSDPELVSFLRKAAESQQTEILRLLAEILNLACLDEEGIAAIVRSELTSMLQGLLLDEDLGVAQAAESAILNGLKKSNSFFDAFFKAPWAARILSHMNNCSETLLIRVLDTFVSVGRISSKAFKICEEGGIYDEIVKCYSLKDPLVEATVIELINRLCEFEEGFHFVRTRNLLYYLLGDLENELIRSLLGTPIMLLVSECIRNYPSVVSELFQMLDYQFPKRLQALLDTSTGDRVKNLMCFVGCWSCINCHECGYIELMKHIPNASTQVAQFVSTTEGTEIAIASLLAWTSVLQHKDPVLELLASCVKNELLPEVLKNLLDYPTEEFRPRNYELLSVLVKRYPFVIDKFFNSESHRKLLLDFDSEKVSGAFDAKHRFAKDAFTNYKSFIKSLAGNDFTKQLESYVDSGPYYRPSRERFSMDSSAV